MFKKLFGDWELDDWVDHLIFFPTVIFLIYSLFFHGSGH